MVVPLFFINYLKIEVKSRIIIITFSYIETINYGLVELYPLYFDMCSFL